MLEQRPEMERLYHWMSGEERPRERKLQTQNTQGGGTRREFAGGGRLGVRNQGAWSSNTLQTMADLVRLRG